MSRHRRRVKTTTSVGIEQRRCQWPTIVETTAADPFFENPKTTFTETAAIAGEREHGAGDVEGLFVDPEAGIIRPSVKAPDQDPTGYLGEGPGAVGVAVVRDLNEDVRRFDRMGAPARPGVDSLEGHDDKTVGELVVEHLGIIGCVRWTEAPHGGTAIDIGALGFA